MTNGPDVPARPDPEALARDLERLAREAPAKLAERLTALSLREQAELALRLPAPERLELLLHAPRPMRLVRSLPDAEVYLTVREVGPSDALPLLALTSAEQILHLMDLESWRKDRFDATRAGAWAALLLEAGEPTAVRFLRSADDEVLALLFAGWARARSIDEDDGPSIDGTGETESGTEEGFLSPCGAYRFSPAIHEHAPAVRRLAQIFFRNQPDRYRQILWAVTWELSSEMEEQALHWRQSRIEEHGFPPWEEALAVYAPPAGVGSRAEPLPPLDPDRLPAPRTPLRLLAGWSVLRGALERFSGDERERILHELTSVANHVLVADAADTGDPQAHRKGLEKTASYVSVGIAARGIKDAAAAADLLRRLPVVELFREGYARAAALQARARRLVGEGWAAEHPTSLELLDAPLRGRLVGLLEPRPLYLDLSGEQGPVYREFRSPGEIEETLVAVELAELLGGVVARELGFSVAHIVNTALERELPPPRLSVLFLTGLAWHAIRDELRSDPLPPEVAVAFLASARPAPDAVTPRSRELLERFLARLCGGAGLDRRAQSALLAFGLACLERLEMEWSGLPPGTAPDTRGVTSLILRGPARIVGD